MNKSFIQEFEIIGLFGYKDICIRFKNSTLIVIGENGFGKTSILNALNYVLCHSYNRLLEIKFNAVRLCIDEMEYRFERGLIERYANYLKRVQEDDRTMIDFVLQHLNTKTLNAIINLLDNGKKSEFYALVNNDEFLKTIPGNILYQEFYSWNEMNKSFREIRQMEKQIDDKGITVLYYPTYRRVEVDYEHLFPIEDRRRSIRLNEDMMRSENNDMKIRFGMRDVICRIIKITDVIRKTSLEGFTDVSGGVIHQLLDSSSNKRHELNCTLEELRIVLDRAGNRLDRADKDIILMHFQNHDVALFDNASLLFYLEQLLIVYHSQEKYDSAIIKFRDTCNKYLNDKQFVYDASNVTLQIYRCINGEIQYDPNQIVELEQLSSGEKQIVSIFSQIYLELDKKYAVLFDEPELSLSIYWQENLIPDIINSGNCAFLMAVTHSPFIFSKELQQYTVGMREFLKK